MPWRPARRVVESEEVTAVEGYELTTQGGATDFARLIAACEAFGPYCLIGGLGVDCFVVSGSRSTRLTPILVRSLPIWQNRRLPSGSKASRLRSILTR